MMMLSNLFVFCSIIITSILIEGQSIEFEILDSVLLEDILPPSSSKCRLVENVEENDKLSFVSFEHTKSPSFWNGKHAKLEPMLFLAEMSHSDPNPSRIWTLRIGQGGNIYSYRGGFGEAVPPQNHLNAPFVDEVWQMVSVNQNHNRNSELPPYYVHQGGTYLSNKELETPFFSPNIVKHCEQKAGISQCSFGSWGQHAHIPTTFESSVLYFNRYQDCGNGVLEVTSVIQNIADNPETLGYFNVPWGGVRTSNLQDLFLSKPNGEMYLYYPLLPFDVERTMPNLKDTGGYTSFVNNVKKSNYGFDPNAFYMPEVGEDGNVLPIDEIKKRHRQRRLKEQQMQNISAQNMQQNKTNVCEDEEMNGDNLINTKMKVISKEVDNTTKSMLRLVVRNNNPCRESLNHTKRFNRRMFRLEIKPTVEIKSGEKVCSLIFENKRNGEKFAVQQILHWSWAGNSIYFSPMDDYVSPQYINQRFAAGDQIKVTYTDLGTTGGDSLALTFVHGVDHDSQKHRIQLPSRIRFGSTDLGRDYTVYTTNIRTPVNAGETYVNRQYIIVDRLKHVKTQAAIWNKETYQNVIRSGEYKSRQIKLVSSLDGKTFGAIADDHSCEKGHVDVCTGSSTPKPDLKAIFYIECGELKYVGSNRYVFSLESEDKRNNINIIRSYTCVEGKDFRPTWILLGYFKEGDCEDLNGLHFQANFCISPDVCPIDTLEQNAKSPLKLSQSDEL